MVAHFPEPSGSSMSTLVGTRNAIWSGIYIFSSIVGFILLIILTKILYIRRLNITTRWLQGLVCIGCMFASIILFGGTVILCWRRWERSHEDHEEHEDAAGLSYFGPHVEEASQNIVSLASAHYGKRPNFEAIFNSVADKWGDVDVGVLVCGPPGLQGSVAAECRSQSLRSRWNHPISHFNSHSFDL